MSNSSFRQVLTRTCSQCGKSFTPPGTRSFQCSDECRFWSNVNKRGLKMPHLKTRCWEWQKYRMKHGYGMIVIKGKCIGAHRYSYIINKGPLGDNYALHRCDNPSCVRPSHLFKGDQRSNVIDCINKGRRATNLGRKLKRKASNKGQRSSNKGKKKPNAVFTKKQVERVIIEAEIIKKGTTFKYPGATTKLAAKYGVSPSAIHNIISGKSWPELNGFRQKVRHISLSELQALRLLKKRDKYVFYGYDRSRSHSLKYGC